MFIAGFLGNYSKQLDVVQTLSYFYTDDGLKNEPTMRNTR